MARHRRGAAPSPTVAPLTGGQASVGPSAAAVSGTGRLTAVIATVRAARPTSSARVAVRPLSSRSAPRGRRPLAESLEQS